MVSSSCTYMAIASDHNIDYVYRYYMKCKLYTMFYIYLLRVGCECFIILGEFFIWLVVMFHCSGSEANEAFASGAHDFSVAVITNMNSER